MTRTSLMPRSTEVQSPSPMEREMSRLSRDMDRLFGDFFGPMAPLRMFRFPEEGSGLSFSPRCDMEDAENNFILTAEVPGFQRDELNVDVSGETLTLKGERQISLISLLILLSIFLSVCCQYR